MSSYHLSTKAELLELCHICEIKISKNKTKREIIERLVEYDNTHGNLVIDISLNIGNLIYNELVPTNTLVERDEPPQSNNVISTEDPALTEILDIEGLNSQNTSEDILVENIIIDNHKHITEIKQKGMSWVDKLLKSDITFTTQGSISYLLHGKKPSEQSINIKIGKLGEFISKELIKSNPKLELLDCGIRKINNKQKDVDLIFKDEANKIIYYFELKGNIQLDTEKLPATINKCKEIENSLKNQYSEYTIVCRILNWSIYNRKNLTAGISNIKTFEKQIKIDHMEDFLNIINIVWKEEDYYLYFREIGIKINSYY